MSEEFQRPQTSTRDYDELRQRLAVWLRERLPGGPEPVVSALEVPAGNGMSSETLLFDVTIGADVLACVARVEPEASAVPVFPSYDLAKQFRTIGLVATETGVPVPRPLWLEVDPVPIGSPFFVMERVDGEVPPDLMPYNFGSWLSEAGRDDQRRLQDSTVAALAELHALDRDRVAFLELDRPEPTALRRHVADQWAYHRWVIGELRQPLIERCFAWLDDHWPAEADAVDRAGLSWGDARIGNVLYRDFTPVGVLDWEMASIAPPELDLAWMIFLHRFFEDIAVPLGLPGMPHFMRRNDVAATYEAASGHTPQDLDFYLLYAALRHGIVMTRVAQRAIAFGEAEMPDDPDDLVMHRSTLEAMLAGSYWPNVP
jgi:aminoglycoside phosphotransferase (APT) family kinase protein